MGGTLWGHVTISSGNCTFDWMMEETDFFLPVIKEKTPCSRVLMRNNAFVLPTMQITFVLLLISLLLSKKHCGNAAGDVIKGKCDIPLVVTPDSAGC